MSFLKSWSELQSNLRPGTLIKNWTVAKGYLGDEFKIVSVSSTQVDVDSPAAETIQRVSKKDFEIMFNHWDQYCSGELKRRDLVRMTRVSKYTMSIFKHLTIQS
jgi:hypothetical protein